MNDIIKNRHSVRQYTSKPIEHEKRKILDDLISQINKRSGLRIQACYNEPTVFDTFMAHYGKFENVKNYIVLVGTKNKDEQIGYYGEQLVLKTQELGLNSCWVALTYGKRKVDIYKDKGEKIYCVIALGYGKTAGIGHAIKSTSDVSNIQDSTPQWFIDGVNCALLAPTAMNQQKFKFIYNNGKVKASAGKGFYTKIDLGIAKCHFEIGANHSVDWED